MTERGGIFSGDDPFAIFADWLEEARKSEPNDPNAMTIATVDTSGLPNARIVLLKELEENAIVFYTNYQSAKGQELDQSGKVAALLHWKTLRRQVRFRGRVERVSAEQSDAYFASRPIESRIGAWASAQSKPLSGREELEQKVTEYTKRFGKNPTRPPHWGGYRIFPTEIEFWADGANRLHDRYKWNCLQDGINWRIQRLSP